MIMFVPYILIHFTLVLFILCVVIIIIILIYCGTYFVLNTDSCWNFFWNGDTEQIQSRGKHKSATRWHHTPRLFLLKKNFTAQLMFFLNVFYCHIYAMFFLSLDNVSPCRYYEPVGSVSTGNCTTPNLMIQWTGWSWSYPYEDTPAADNTPSPNIP